MGFKKILVIGNFNDNNLTSNGQVIKTEKVLNVISSISGYRTEKMDTYPLSQNQYFKFLFSVNKILKSNALVILPAKRGLTFLFPLIYFISRISNKEIIYIVIGGWLPQFLATKRRLLRKLKRIKFILAETKMMVSELNSIDLKNVRYLPNFREQFYKERPDYHCTPGKLRTFFLARVIESKGIFDLIHVMKSDRIKGKRNIELDIYGPIDAKISDRFHTAIEGIPYIRYAGNLPVEKVIPTIKDYDLMVFPTYYPGEGFPGSVIDAYMAGVPVLASNFRYNPEIIDEGLTGFLFQARNSEELTNKLIEIYENRHKLSDMRNNCFKKSEEFSFEFAKNIMTDVLQQLER